MQQGLKQRLVGGLVILALVVIFLPMALQGPVEHTRVDVPIQVPPEPEVPADGVLPPPDFTAQPTPGQGGEGRSGRQPGEDEGQADASTTSAPEEATGGNNGQPLVAEGQQETAEQGNTAPAGRPGSWIVQVGAFSDPANAERLRERLIDAGFGSAYSEPSRADGERLHRVRVGPVVTRADAEALAQRLQRSLELDGILVPR